MFGLFPALQISRGNLHDTLKEGTRGNSVAKSFLRSTLVVAQIAFALVALVGALLFVRTFLNLGAFDVGLRHQAADVDAFLHAGRSLRAAGREAAPGRRHRPPRRGAARGASDLRIELGPARRRRGGGAVIIDGVAVQKGEETNISVIGVTPHFNSTLGLAFSKGATSPTLKAGRTPRLPSSTTDEDTVLAQDTAIGRRFRLDGPNEDWFTIIGVTPDMNLYGVNPSNEQAPTTAYVPFAYQQFLNTGLTIRVDGDPAGITATVREAIRASDPNLPMAQVRTVSELRRLNFWQYGLYGWIFGTTGVVGLLLAAIGVYGVLSYSVSQRAQEIGVRVALGASHREILTLVVGQGLVLAAIGIVTGCVLAGAAMPAARSLLFKVSPFDPLTFGGVAIFLGTVACLASYLPARRATHVDPIIVLRGE